MAKDDDRETFPWLHLFFITSFTFFFFGILIAIMDGYCPRFILKVGTISFVLGSLTWLNQRSKKKRRPSTSY